MKCIINLGKEKNLPKKTWIKKWLMLVLNAMQRDHVEVHVDFVDMKTIQSLNKQFRAKDYATNVLSFPLSVPLPRQMCFLGDIILCAEVIEEEAKAQDKSFEDHLAHMLIHGCLHLLGYDHIIKKEAKIMEALEIKLLNDAGVKNPYES